MNLILNVYNPCFRDSETSSEWRVAYWICIFRGSCQIRKMSFWLCHALASQRFLRRYGVTTHFFGSCGHFGSVSLIAQQPQLSYVAIVQLQLAFSTKARLGASACAFFTHLCPRRRSLSAVALKFARLGTVFALCHPLVAAVTMLHTPLPETSFAKQSIARLTRFGSIIKKLINFAIKFQNDVILCM